MSTFRIVPDIEFYDRFADFAEHHQLSAKDLILTNEPIYNGVISDYNLDCQVIFQEKFGLGEPTDQMLDDLLNELGKLDFDRIIGVGGGTVVDISKALAVALPEDTTDDLYERMPTLQKTHPLYIIPTTCGTGAEVTNIGIFNRTKLGVKVGLVHENMYPDKAVLITEMLMSLPYPVFATSSIDALVHAVESYLSPKASPLSEMFSVQAIRMIVGAWKEVVAAGDKESWKNRASDFLRASTYAGIAFGNAGCAAVHALSYPMGGRYHVPHGQSNQLMFAAVMRKYKEKQPIGKLQLLEDILAEILQTTPAEALETLYRLMDDILPLKALRDFGTKTEELAEFARSVMETQQRLMANNYVELSEADVLAIYESAY